ncbi:MAG: hypothetical protein WAT22_13700 [Saprospiraceae bacterium]|jgi:hypothetical protein|nr:hypothetical protein [Saprospiraceae bacterium]MBP6446786.1 hypothetical protein [Saprospiraceae bacterium]
MKPNQVETLDIRRKPIIAINKKLNNARNMELPQFKIDNVENAKKNTNLLELIDKINKERITKP